MTKMRYLRGKEGESMCAFARRLGLHHGMASPIETGKLSCPPKWRQVIAEALSVTVEEIFDEHGFAIKVD